MKRIKKLLLCMRIYFIVAKYGLNSAALFLKILIPLRFLNSLNPRNWFRKKTTASYETSSLSLRDFKPLFSEFGSLLSNRQDLNLEAVTQEFNKLKNKISPDFSTKGVIIEHTNDPPCDASPFSKPEAPDAIPFKNEDIRQQVKKLWNELNNAQISGESVVQQIGSLVSNRNELKKCFRESIHHNIVAYLEKELRIFPSRDELNDFFNELDDLSLSVERLQAHINQLVSAHETN
ncbi:hypothetical protein TUM19329_34320 [Legionella antarctica]|uniref:Uncharacterized protein n=1 Tax=Legionella antarctica TaxID=2708020 RepID=A0A6F8T9E5_9GAMM|nr:hypothetical protein [Legionella antarctica]BCA97071.1 hypothetical protein TUM19329_34320 [Legionella antarctica]